MADDKKGSIFLHLSDFQFKRKDNLADADLFCTFLQDIESWQKRFNRQIDSILIGGNISFSGQSAEYELAYEKIKKMLEITGVRRENLFLVPGNHDVDREEITVHEEALIQSVNDKRCSFDEYLQNSETHNLFLEKFQHYLAFLMSIGASSSFWQEDKEGKIQPWYSVRKRIGDYPIRIIGLTPFLLTRRSVNASHDIQIGKRQIQETFNSIRDDEFVIVLSHYPMDSFEPEEKAAIKLLMKKKNIIFASGHSHQKTDIGPCMPNSEEFLSISAGNLFSGSTDTIGYTLFQLDLAKQSLEFWPRKHSPDLKWSADNAWALLDSTESCTIDLPRTLYIIEFFSWFLDKHSEIDLLGNISSQELSNLVSAFCKDKQYVNEKGLLKEVKRWISGNAEEETWRYLAEIGARANREWKGEHRELFVHSQKVPFHATFLFLSAGDFPGFIQKYFEDLNYLTQNYLYIYYSVEDLRRKVSCYEVLDQLRSIHPTPIELPALLLWKQTFNACRVIPLKQLSHEEIFNLMQFIIQEIKAGKELGEISSHAKMFIHHLLPDDLRMHQIIVKKGDVVMRKEETNISGVTVKGKGKALVGHFVGVNADLSTIELNQLSEMTEKVRNALLKSQLSADEKSEGIDILKEINSEVKKEQPNGKRLSRLVERLKGASKNLPEIIQTTEAIINILSKILGHN